MKSLRWSAAGSAVLILCASLATACSPTFVVVPGPGNDTVYDTVEVDRLGTRPPRVQRVPVGVDTVRIVRVDTVLRVDTVRLRAPDTVTVVRVDTVLVPTSIPRGTRVDTVVRVDTVLVPTTIPRGTRVDTVLRVDTVRTVRVDTLRELRVDTVLSVRVDTVRLVRPDTVRLVRVDTVLRVDTLRRTGVDTVRVTTMDTVLRVDTLRLTRADTVVRVDTIVSPPDTVRLSVVDTLLRVDTIASPPDTVRVAVVDTLLRVDTVRVATVDTVVVPGRRLLFVPPGQHPPEGQCRIWVHGRPPGQQADAAPCDALGDVPAGAFILFGGDAWDFDYDWLREAQRNPGSVPPQIVAVKRRGSG